MSFKPDSMPVPQMQEGAKDEIKAEYSKKEAEKNLDELSELTRGEVMFVLETIAPIIEDRSDEDKEMAEQRALKEAKQKKRERLEMEIKAKEWKPGEGAPEDPEERIKKSEKAWKEINAQKEALREADLAEAERLTQQLKVPGTTAEETGAEGQNMERETRQLAETFLEKTKKIVNDQAGIAYRIRGSKNLVDKLIEDLKVIREQIVDGQGDIIPAQVELKKVDIERKIRMIDAIEGKFQAALGAS
jgi:hypothetical protein